LITSAGLHYHYYADDLLIYGQISKKNFASSLHLFTHCLHEVQEWFSANHMILNADKTDCLLLATPQNLPFFKDKIHINFSGSVITPKSHIKYLGITLDSTLSFNQHTANMAGAIRSVARAVRLTRPSLSHNAAVGLAVSLGLSKLDYCNSILANTSKSNIMTIQRAQNALARSVLRQPLSSSATTMLSSLHWLPVSKRIAVKACCLAYKAINGLLPPYMNDAVSLYQPPRPLRSAAAPTMVIHNSKLKTGSRRFSIYLPKIWNSLPPI
jgi:hypothetical protein